MDCRLALIADIQIGAGRDVPEYLARYRKTLCVHAIKSLRAQHEEKALDAILVLGDLVERPDVTPFENDLLVEFVLKLDLIGVPVYILTGNHDLSRKAGTTALCFLKKLADKKRLRNTKLATVVHDLWKISGYTFLAAPYSVTDQIPSLIKKYKPDFVCGHYYHKGCTLFGKAVPKRIASRGHDLKYDSVGGCFLGDIHKRQIVEGKVWYPGSLIQNKFSEPYKTRGYCIVEISDREVINTIPVNVQQDHPLVTVKIRTNKDIDKIEWDAGAWYKVFFGQTVNISKLPPNVLPSKLIPLDIDKSKDARIKRERGRQDELVLDDPLAGGDEVLTAAGYDSVLKNDILVKCEHIITTVK